MGYTHYMSDKPAFTNSQWTAFRAEAHILLANSDVPLTGPFGKGKIRVASDHISFNGVGEDAHETCYIPKGPESFIFCKTARKPYDKVVVQVYKLVRKYLPATKLSSDGGEAVFGNVVVVEGRGGTPLTYSAGNFKVNVGDIVELPSTSKYGRGEPWEAEVIATESSYEGALKPINGVVTEAIEFNTSTDDLDDAIAEIIVSKTGSAPHPALCAARDVIELIKARLGISS